MLFDNREIKEHSRKTQRELSKEISSLTSELKDERDRIHELQKENRKLRQEVKIDQKPNVREPTVPGVQGIPDLARPRTWFFGHVRGHSYLRIKFR